MLINQNCQFLAYRCTCKHVFKLLISHIRWNIFSIRNPTSFISNSSSMQRKNHFKKQKFFIKYLHNLFCKIKAVFIKRYNLTLKPKAVSTKQSPTWTMQSATSCRFDSISHAWSPTIFGRMTYPSSFHDSFAGRWARAPGCPCCQLAINLNARETWSISHACSCKLKELVKLLCLERKIDNYFLFNFTIIKIM